ncbi:predicted protein [Aspergillus nidulans FGSC A4]|nr:predicted protein [Aspergillus nidulans FGSC A4]|eukprot:XP_658674.1 predicted protein [Aspergillus nidulans FGSC A4]
MAIPRPSTPPEAPLEVTEISERSQSSRWLSRDDWIRILTLQDAGFTYQQISSQLGFTYRQVQYTCQNEQSTPQKPPGQRPKLSEEDMDNIITFISSSQRTRRLSYKRVIEELNLPCGETALARALKKRGYSRCKALRKPPLLDNTKRASIPESGLPEEQEKS